jgi:hypothetical protein
MLTDLLHQRLTAAGIPIITVAYNAGVYRVDYDASATTQQRIQGDAMVAAFDPVAEQATLDAERDTRRELAGAIQAELDYLETTIPGIGGMNTAQVRSTVERLAKENRNIIKLLVYLSSHL